MMRAKDFLIEVTNINQYVDEGELIGYVTTTNEPELKNYLESQGADKEIINDLIGKYQTIGVFRNLYVDPDSRRQGIGNKLISSAIRDAADNGAEAIVLVSDIHQSNEVDLVRWYKSFGFEIIGDASGDPIMLLEL